MSVSQQHALASPPSSSESDTSSAVPLDLREDHEWQDVEDDNEDVSYKSFFSGKTLSSVQSFLADCKQEHGLDFANIVNGFELDFYGTIKLVNYIRFQVKAGNTKPDVSSKDAFSDDKYLQPVLPDDALLFSLDDILESVKTGDSQVASQDPPSRVTELEEQLARLQLQFQEYRTDVAKLIDDRWTGSATPADSQPKSTFTPTDESSLQSSSSLAPSSRPTPARPSASNPRKPFQDNDTYYFDSYAYNDIHETMLKDAIRTDAYRDFIYAHKPLFAGKTVLDVGCGTGILSMFAARAGAARVFAVDNSSIARKARQNIAANGLSHIITVFQGKIEDIALPLAPGEKVDVLVSEWMGYALLYEAMLPSILFARTAYLHPTAGILAPSHTTLRIAPVADPDYIADAVSFWTDVYGFDMRPMTEGMHADVVVRSPTPSELCGSAATFKLLDLYRVGNVDLDFARAPFALTLSRNVDALDAFVIWFDTFFLPARPADARLAEDATAEAFAAAHKPEEGQGVAFTTGPGGKRTHWDAAMLIIDRTSGRGARAQSDLPLEKGSVITGTVGYARREDNDRQLDIVVEWAVQGDGATESGRQTWSLK